MRMRWAVVSFRVQQLTCLVRLSLAGELDELLASLGMTDPEERKARVRYMNSIPCLRPVRASLFFHVFGF
jgi:hypothetical protein